MKLGAEPKKVAILAGLLVVAGYVFISNNMTDSGPDYTPRATVPEPAATPASTSGKPPARLPSGTSGPVRARNERSSLLEFRPSLKPRRPEDRPDPMTIDPTLRLDLLEKLQEVKIDKVKRSLFDFSTAPLPEKEEPKISPEKLKEMETKRKEAAAKLAKAKPAKPPPPPINLKFYGFISPASSDDRRAFFLDGEDIFVVEEGDLIQKRYKVVKIGVNSAVVEDTDHDHKQTLRLEEVKTG